MFGLQSASQVHQGHKKKNNEDYVTLFEPAAPRELEASGCLYVLADGVGGAAQGERAAKYAADKVLYDYYAQPEAEPADRLRRSITSAGADIYAYAADSPRVARMATTIVAAVVRANLLYVANVGDSRAYLIRGGQATQVTRDHSIVGELVAAGEMTEEQAMASRAKNRLTRSVGGEAEAHVQLYDPLPLELGDRILLCSDGLTRYANRKKMAELAAQLPPADVASRCIAFANSRGGADNVSVIVIAVGAPSASPAPPPAAFPRPQMPERELLEAMQTDPSALSRSPEKAASRPPAGDRTRKATITLAVLAACVWAGVIALGGVALLSGLLPLPSAAVATPSPIVIAAALPTAAQLSAPTESPAVSALPFVRKEQRADGWYVTVVGGPAGPYREYGKFADGQFVMADAGTFGVYVDFTGNIYVLNFSTPTILIPRPRLAKDELKALINNELPSYELQLDHADNGTYYLRIRETKFGDSVEVLLPRSMTD